MSGIQPSLNISKSSQTFNINQTRQELRTPYEKIMYHIQHQIFFDPDLDHQQRMFLLYQPAAIEKEFLLHLYDWIYNLNISEGLRDTLFSNLSKLSEDLIAADMYSGINRHHIADNDSDEDAYAETSSHIDSDDNDTSNDLDNQSLDEIDFQRDLTASQTTANTNEPLSTDDIDKDNLSN
jgi:hypothetical protein